MQGLEKKLVSVLAPKSLDSAGLDKEKGAGHWLTSAVE